MTDPLPDTRRMGRNMALLAGAALLGLMAWFFQGILESDNNPNTDPASLIAANGAREVTLLQNRAGHYISSGKINGHAVTFMLDTGATAVAIPAGIADRIGLQRGHRQQVRTANGTIEVFSARLDSVRIGPIVLRNVHANINPQMDADDEILLGMSFLKHLEMSQQDNMLRLRQ